MGKDLFVAEVSEWLDLPELQIAEIANAGKKANIYDVRKVGFLITDENACKRYDIKGATSQGKNMYLPTIVIRTDEGDRLYRLPIQLGEWVIRNVGLAHSGTNLFPSKVEFGILDGRVYAEFVDL